MKKEFDKENRNVNSLSTDRQTDRQRLRVLVACEESQAVCKAFRELGHEAYSCDLLDCSGGHDEWHIRVDALQLLKIEWDLVIAHPPCTYLTIAANKLYLEDRYGEKAIERKRLREEALEFFMSFVNAKCEHIAIENPVGVVSTRYRKPDCIIQPYQFGHPVSKKTCLWLKNLPPLKPTNIVEPEVIHSKGKSGGYSGALWVVRDESGKILSYRDPRVARLRSKTFPGIAKAMAEQWSEYILNEDCRQMSMFDLEESD